MHYIKTYVRIADAISERVGSWISWLTVAMVVVVCLNVGLRYVAGRSVLALQDLSWYMFGAVMFLGAGFALLHERHVRVDVLFSHYPERRKAWIDLICTLVLLIPFCVLGFWMSLDFVGSSFAILERSPDPGGLPLRFIPKAFIPVGFLLLLLQAIAEAGRRIVRLQEHN